MNSSDNEKLEFYIKQAKRLIHLGGFNDGVLKILNEILEIDPRNEYAFNELLKINIKKGKDLNNNCEFEKAVKIFDEVLTIDPKNKNALNNKYYALKSQEINILYGKGKDLDELDKYLEAIECYENVLKIDPENKFARENKKHILDEIDEWKKVTRESALEIIHCKNNCHRHNKFRYAPKEFKNDKEFVLDVVKFCGGNTLKYASLELRTDREVVLEAVSKFGWALQYASIELQNDREI